MQSEQLLQTLIEQTRTVMNQAEKLKAESMPALTWKETSNTWNILECLEHLNLYGDFYLPEIERAIKSSKTQSEAVFKSGMLGGYFSKSMMPREQLNKMKTFKDKDPINHVLDKESINRFINQQLKMIDLLYLAQHVSLNKVKISISISRFIKLKLGDTFQFIINHNLRHLKQIEKIQALIKKEPSINKVAHPPTPLNTILL